MQVGVHTKTKIRQAVKSLPDTEKVVIWLYYFEGYKAYEIGKMLHWKIEKNKDGGKTKCPSFCYYHKKALKILKEKLCKTLKI